MDEEVSEHIAESAPETEPTETEENTLEEESAEAEESTMEEETAEAEENTMEEESAEAEESNLEEKSAETEETTLEEESVETEESALEKESAEAEESTSEEESAEMEKGTPEVILAEAEESTLGANATETKEIDVSLTIDTTPVDETEATDDADGYEDVATFNKRAVTVCGGTIARKFLNWKDAFCLEEDKEYPAGALYYYKQASEAAYTGPIGWLTIHYSMTCDFSDYSYSIHQAAIWAVAQGKTSYSEALEWGRNYAASVHMNSGVDEYVEDVAQLVVESQRQSLIAYMYDPVDSANQRVILWDIIWGNKEVKKQDPWKAKCE
jgi:chemotaxis protein histidine kinase CheA